MIASLHNDKNEITIPGFYDVIQISDGERKEMAKACCLSNYKKELDINDVHGEERLFNYGKKFY